LSPNSPIPFSGRRLPATIPAVPDLLLRFRAHQRVPGNLLVLQGLSLFSFLPPNASPTVTVFLPAGPRPRYLSVGPPVPEPAPPSPPCQRAPPKLFSSSRLALHRQGRARRSSQPWPFWPWSPLQRVQVVTRQLVDTRWISSTVVAPLILFRET
jgi:hypothetical protein